MFAWAKLELFATEVAVTVTKPPFGIEEGAV
jgi:hypothetical protein